MGMWPVPQKDSKPLACITKTVETPFCRSTRGWRSVLLKQKRLYPQMGFSPALCGCRTWLQCGILGLSACISWLPHGGQGHFHACSLLLKLLPLLHFPAGNFQQDLFKTGSCGLNLINLWTCCAVVHISPMHICL